MPALPVHLDLLPESADVFEILLHKNHSETGSDESPLSSESNLHVHPASDSEKPEHPQAFSDPDSYS